MYACGLCGAFERLSDRPDRRGEVEVALDAEATLDADREQLLEARVAPLVAVRAERRDAVAEEEVVLSFGASFGDIERVAAGGIEELHDDLLLIAERALGAEGKARERRAHVGREKIHFETPFV